MISFFANLFGYVLNFLYEIFGNFGIAIIIFSIIVKLIMLPISINQQKTMKKSKKINEEMKQIQFKYKNDPEKLNQEVMSLYKREKMSPFSGCFSAIVQLILLFSIFYLVRSPLTYMSKVDADLIDKVENIVEENDKTNNYKEIAVVNYVNQIKEHGYEDNNEFSNDKKNIYDNIDKLYINMNFIGIDLSKVPSKDFKDIKAWIIPILYVISSFISIRLSTNISSNKKDAKNNLIGDGTENKESNEDPMAEANKSMSLFMPIMSISIACIAPLGLALYWLINNILMIIERISMNIIFKDKEEADVNA